MRTYEHNYNAPSRGDAGHNQKVLAEILGNPLAHARNDYASRRKIKPIKLTDPAAREMLDEAGAKVRRAYANGVTEAARGPRIAGAAWHDALAENWMTVYELGNCVADDAELSLCRSIFERAGIFGAGERPTSLRAQVEMQTIAVVYASRCKSLFMHQTALDL